MIKPHVTRFKNLLEDYSHKNMHPSLHINHANETEKKFCELQFYHSTKGDIRGA